MMDSNLPEWISAIASVLVAIAAICAARQGIRSLNAWRDESIGRRKIELAEEMLANIYEARDVLRAVRSPLSNSNDSENRPDHGVETENVRRSRDAYYAIIKRLVDRADFFARINASRYRIIAKFGESAAKPLEQINSLRVEIWVTAEELIEAENDDMPEYLTSLIKEQRSTIWRSSSEDNIEKKLEEIMLETENFYRPIVEGNVV